MECFQRAGRGGRGHLYCRRLQRHLCGRCGHRQAAVELRPEDRRRRRCAWLGHPRPRLLEGQGLRRHAGRPPDRARRQDRQAALGDPHHAAGRQSLHHRRAARVRRQGDHRPRRRRLRPVRGYVTAYDAETGKQLWRFYIVPGDPAKGFENKAMEMAAKTWTGEWWKYGGGGTAWNAITYDPELNRVYIGTGNGCPWNCEAPQPRRRRQPVPLLDRRARRRHRRVRLALPDHARARAGTTPRRWTSCWRRSPSTASRARC